MNWFYTRNRNQQLALLLGTTALGVYLVWALVINPLHNAVAEARLRTLVAQESLQEVRTLAHQLEMLQLAGEKSSATATDVSIPNLIDTSATAAGVIVTSMETGANGESVAVRINRVTEANFYQWLQELENKQQIVIEFLTMAPLADHENISASIRLRSR